MRSRALLVPPAFAAVVACAAVVAIGAVTPAASGATGARKAPGARASGGIALTDATGGSGIDYVNRCGAAPADKVWLTEAMGAGAAWLDFDGDGRLDLYFVNGSAHDRAPGKGEPNRLYRGDGRGRFRDVTEKSGAGDRGWGYGVAVGDVDNDGDPDLYVTNLGANVLLRNDGDGTFTDVTAKARVGDPAWGTSAAFFDMEGDGDLDLYVANYVAFHPETIPKRASPEAEGRVACTDQGVPVFCGPLGLPPAQDVLYRNDGDGTFTDVTEAAGVRLAKARYALGVVTGDWDNDGDQDVYVANDSVENSLWENRNGRFVDSGFTTLSALNAEGNPQAGMGVDFGDPDGDGWLDIVVTNFANDLNTLYRNVSGKYFEDVTTRAGLESTYMALSWGTEFVDFDNDRDEDLFIANGHIYPQVDDYSLGTRYRQRNHLFVNGGDGRFVVSGSGGSGLAVARSFRGAAFGDYDGDGDVDAVLTAVDEPALLLRNDTNPRGGFLRVRLEGRQSNRDAVGARVSVTAGGVTRIRERKGGGSYLSASEPVLHFGLGPHARADVTVRWPSGLVSRRSGVAANSTLRLVEPDPDPEPQPEPEAAPGPTGEAGQTGGTGPKGETGAPVDRALPPK